MAHNQSVLDQLRQLATDIIPSGDAVEVGIQQALENAHKLKPVIEYIDDPKNQPFDESPENAFVDLVESFVAKYITEPWREISESYSFRLGVYGSGPTLASDANPVGNAQISGGDTSRQPNPIFPPSARSTRRRLTLHPPHHINSPTSSVPHLSFRPTPAVPDQTLRPMPRSKQPMELPPIETLEVPESPTNEVPPQTSRKANRVRKDIADDEDVQPPKKKQTRYAQYMDKVDTDEQYVNTARCSECRKGFARKCVSPGPGLTCYYCTVSKKKCSLVGKIKTEGDKGSTKATPGARPTTKVPQTSGNQPQASSSRGGTAQGKTSHPFSARSPRPDTTHLPSIVVERVPPSMPRNQSPSDSIGKPHTYKPQLWGSDKPTDLLNPFRFSQPLNLTSMFQPQKPNAFDPQKFLSSVIQSIPLGARTSGTHDAAPPLRSGTLGTHDTAPPLRSGTSGTHETAPPAAISNDRNEPRSEISNTHQPSPNSPTSPAAVPADHISNRGKSITPTFPLVRGVRVGDHWVPKEYVTHFHQGADELQLDMLKEREFQLNAEIDFKISNLNYIRDMRQFIEERIANKTQNSQIEEDVQLIHK